jgi:hypothetical protein
MVSVRSTQQEVQNRKESCFLGSFAKIKKKYILTSSCLSVRPNEASALPLNDFRDS